LQRIAFAFCKSDDGHGQRGRQTDRQTDRQGCKQQPPQTDINRQTDRQTNRQGGEKRKKEGKRPKSPFLDYGPGGCVCPTLESELEHAAKRTFHPRQETAQSGPSSQVRPSKGVRWISVCSSCSSWVDSSPLPFPSLFSPFPLFLSLFFVHCIHHPSSSILLFCGTACLSSWHTPAPFTIRYPSLPFPSLHSFILQRLHGIHRLESLAHSLYIPLPSLPFPSPPLLSLSLSLLLSLRLLSLSLRHITVYPSLPSLPFPDRPRW